MKSILAEVLGDSPEIRVLDFLLTFNEFDYTIKQIAREVEAGWTTVEEVIKSLVERGIAKETRTFGRARMFALNRENPFSKLLLKLDLELAKIVAQEEIAVRA